jgi:hypothetical protein
MPRHRCFRPCLRQQQRRTAYVMSSRDDHARTAGRKSTVVSITYEVSTKIRRLSILSGPDLPKYNFGRLAIPAKHLIVFVDLGTTASFYFASCCLQGFAIRICLMSIGRRVTVTSILYMGLFLVRNVPSHPLNLLSLITRSWPKQSCTAPNDIM